MKGSCLCSAIKYEVDQLDMPLVIVTAALVAKRMRQHLSQPQA